MADRGSNKRTGIKSMANKAETGINQPASTAWQTARGHRVSQLAHHAPVEPYPCTLAYKTRLGNQPHTHGQALDALAGFVFTRCRLSCSDRPLLHPCARERHMKRETYEKRAQDERDRERTERERTDRGEKWRKERRSEA